MSLMEASAKLEKRMQAFAGVADLDPESAQAQHRLAHRALDEVLDALAAEVRTGKKGGQDGAKVDTAEDVMAVVYRDNDNGKEIRDA